MKLKHYIPYFYKEFKCIAGKCPDTCCKDWDIVIDEDTEKIYESTPGVLGKMLNDNIITDSDGDRIFLLNNKRECPFLDKDRLCIIQKELGEFALCKTCRDYPKLTLDFTEFTEYMLSFACPESVRIIMQGSGYYLPDVEPVSDPDNGYSNDVMNFLIFARKYTADIFLSDLPYQKKLIDALAYTEYVQELLYNNKADISLLSDIEFNIPMSEKSDRKFVFDLFSQFDIMDEKFRSDVEQAGRLKMTVNEELNEEFSKLSLYYLHRYYFNAIASEDVISCVKSIFCAYVVISALTVLYHAENDFDRRLLIFEKYSREIEHSFENKEMMEEAFCTFPKFATINLISALF